MFGNGKNSTALLLEYHLKECRDRYLALDKRFENLDKRFGRMETLLFWIVLATAGSAIGVITEVVLKGIKVL